MSIINRFEQLFQLIRLSLIGFISLFVSSSLGIEIGIIDVATLSEAPKIAAFQKNLSTEAEKQKVAIEKLQKEYVPLKNEFEKNAMLMDNTTRKLKENELKKQQKNLEVAITAFQSNAMAKQSQLARTISDICAKIAAKKGYDLLLSTEGTVFYANPKLDVTRSALDLIKKSNLP